jgi:DNA recombination protein RmuC
MDITAALLLSAALLLLGILIGLGVGMRIGRARGGDGSAADFRELRRQLTDSESRRAALEARTQAEREHHEQQIALLNSARNQLFAEFRASAAQILESRQKQFSDDSSRQLDAVLKPLQDQIRHFSSQLQELRAREAQERGFLKRELEQLVDLNRQMSEDARNLTEALKGSNKAMGTWGEVILKRVLENSGLEAGREYDLQKEYRDAGGRRFRPDAVVYLPENRNIIIDSKVSLLSYERAFNAAGEEERKAHLKRHVESLRQHIRELAAKDYQDLPGLNAPDFVLMFVPVEGALSSAQEADSSLFQTAMDTRILLVSPSTLYLSLRIVEQMWKGDRQQRNARTIAVKAGALYDKFEGFVADMQKIGDRLEEARSAWVSGGKKLSTGRGNLIKRVQELKELGAESHKEIQQIDIKDEI